MNYLDFIKSAKFEEEKHKLLDTIFMTLQVALTSANVANLRDLFARVQQYQQLDRQTLENVLRQCGGVQLQKWQSDLVVMEY